MKDKTKKRTDIKLQLNKYKNIEGQKNKRRPFIYKRDDAMNPKKTFFFLNALGNCS